jgi:charged multivesicular body protein 4
MWGWFGGQSAQKRKDAPKNAILLLREQLDMLQKREKYLENQMADQETIARENITKNKNGMLLFVLPNQACLKYGAKLGL